MPKPKCFVIQPFDDDNNQLFDDTIKPAIEAAGVRPYRVDQDPSVQILIDSIEENIRKSAICLADITEDNPNVWYEVGYAFAADRPVVLICRRDRTYFPFDIRHRNVLRYGSASRTDFERLGEQITERIKAALPKRRSDAPQRAPHRQSNSERLTATEEAILRTVAESAPPGQSVPIDSISNWNFVNVNEGDYNLSLWGLRSRGYLDIRDRKDEWKEKQSSVLLTDAGWSWLKTHPPSGPRTRSMSGVQILDSRKFGPF